MSWVISRFAAAARERVTKQREALEFKGWKDKLSDDSLIDDLKKLTKELSTVAQKLGQPDSSSIMADMKIDEAQKTIEAFRGVALKLDRSRISIAASFREKRTSIAAALDQYRDSEKAITQLGVEKSEDTTGKQKLEQELGSLTKELTSLKTMWHSLEEPAKSARTIDLRLGQLKETLTSIKSKVGDESAQRSMITNLKNGLEKLQTEINTFSKQKQLVVVALDYLQDSKPGICPVCSQEIKLDKVIENLRMQSLDQLSKQTEAAIAKLTKTQEELRKLEAEGAAYERLTTEQAKLDAEMHQVITQVEKVIGQKLETSDQLTGTLETLNQKIESLNKHKIEIEANIQAINERTKIIEHSRIMQGKASTKLQELMSKSAQGQELLALAEKEADRLRGLESDLSNSETLDNISDHLTDLEKVTAYLDGWKELKKLEQEIPKIQDVAKDLEKRLGKITDLEGSLASISEILRAHLENSVTDLLGSLESTINEYYTSISGHPYFVKIHLEPDPKKPLIYNVRAVSKDETISTYVPTRFSSAQMNVVGISLFLAHSQKMLSQLSPILMDDPTQSFDDTHKEKLVKLIKELSNSRQVLVATQDKQFCQAIEESGGTRVSAWEFSEWSEQGPVVQPEK
jgi:DNA repair exonuclease SbcCD ATPase subunit